MPACKKIVLILLTTLSSLLLPFAGRAQFQFIDTIKASFHHKPKFLLDLGAYNSNINDQHVLITDVSVGVVFNKRIYLSAGRSFLNTNVYSDQTVYNSAGVPYTTTAELKTEIYIITAEYVFWKSYPLIVSVIPFKVGIGNAHYEYISEPDKKWTRVNENTIVTYHPQFYASCNILTWIGISGSVGYRFVPFSAKQYHSDLASYTYSYGVKFFLDPIYDFFFPNGICKKKKKEETK
jgi:hypothetical protein